MTSQKPRRTSPLSLPNILTYGRIVAVPVVVACLFWPAEIWVRWVAFGAFAAAAVTDYFDGYIARLWGAAVARSGACSIRSPTSSSSPPAS